MLTYNISFNFTAEVISRLIKVGRHPHRPDLPKVEDDTPVEATTLVTDCWLEDPTTRPTFDKVIKMIQSINKDQ